MTYQAPAPRTPVAPVQYQPAKPAMPAQRQTAVPNVSSTGSTLDLAGLQIPRDQLNEIGIDDQVINEMLAAAKTIMNDPNIAAIMNQVGGAGNISIDPNRLIQQLGPMLQGVMGGGNMNLGNMGGNLPNLPNLSNINPGAINPGMLAPVQGSYAGLDDLLR